MTDVLTAPAAPAPARPARTPRRAEIAAGVRDSLAAGLGMFPLGVAFGLLVVQAGLPWWFAPALSVAGFAGSLELLVVGLAATVTPLGTIALTTLLVNFRHVFYAFSFPLHVVRHPVARTYSMYALIDEAYALTAASPGRWTAPRLLSLQLSFQAYWVSGGLAGVLLAGLLPGPLEGLDFALCALFVTLVLDAARGPAQVPSLLLAGLSFTLAVLLAPGSALFTGMLGFVVLLAGRHALESRRSRRA